MARTREKLFLRQDGRCYYCAQQMTLRTYSIKEPLAASDVTIEHLVPRVLGGRNIPQNLVAACHRCNLLGARIDKWSVDTFGGRRATRAESFRATRAN
jgi:5-methylcytosine-specific restriction endonuclease McrA